MKVSQILIKHGKHSEDCAFFDGKPECDCGLLGVLSEVTAIMEGAGNDQGILGQASEAQD